MLLKENILEKTNERLEKENEILRKENALLRARLLGLSKSEKVSDEQLSFALDELDDERELQQQAEEFEVNSHKRKKKSIKQRESKHPEDIETERVELIPAEVLKNPDSYTQIGEEVSEKLEIIPMKFVRKIIARLKFKKKEDIDGVPFCVPLPPMLIPRSIASASLITHVIVGKYCDHLPLNRLEQIFKRRYQIELPRQRMSDWIGYVVENWLSLIYYSIKSDLLQSNYLQVDETPIRYLDHDHKGNSKNGYMWVYANPKGNILFDWQLGRGYKNVEKLLSKYEGIVQCDGYSVYDKIAAKNNKVDLLGCWAHVRRKFYEAFKNEVLEAAPYLLLIRKLYAVEKVDEQKLAKARKEQSVGIVEEIKNRLDKDADRYWHDPKMTGAITYARNQWNKLTGYLNNSELKIDNNMIERGIRPTKLGAKNWLFIGHPKAGQRSAILYTILESCKRNNINSVDYLNDVLNRLPEMTNKEFELAKMTPDKWQPQSTS